MRFLCFLLLFAGGAFAAPPVLEREADKQEKPLLSAESPPSALELLRGAVRPPANSASRKRKAENSRPGRQRAPRGPESEDLRQILHAPDSETLKKILDRQKKRDFLKKLCEAQKRFANIPSACYRLKPFDSASDPFCLRLRLKDLEPEILRAALALSVLSRACRRHLQMQLKILNYRKLRKREGAPFPFSAETEENTFL